MSFPIEPHIHKQWILDAIKNINPSSVLDVGCAGGTGIWVYANALPNVSFVGTDIDSLNIDGRQELFDGMNVRLQLGDIRDIQFEDDSFDLVLSDSVFNLLKGEDAITAAKEVKRVAKKHVLLLEQEMSLNYGNHDYNILFPGHKRLMKVEGYGSPLWDEHGYLMLWSKV